MHEEEEAIVDHSQEPLLEVEAQEAERLTLRGRAGAGAAHVSPPAHGEELLEGCHDLHWLVSLVRFVEDLVSSFDVAIQDGASACKRLLAVEDHGAQLAARVRHPALRFHLFLLLLRFFGGSCCFIVLRVAIRRLFLLFLQLFLGSLLPLQILQYLRFLIVLLLDPLVLEERQPLLEHLGHPHEEL